MAKDLIMENLSDENLLVPVKPAPDSYKVPFITAPASFMMYGENALKEYEDEVSRVEAEIRMEIYGQTETAPVAVKQKGANFSSVLIMILSLLIIGILIIGRFVTLSPDMAGIFAIAERSSGLDYVLNLANGIVGGAALEINSALAAAGIAVSAVFALISFVGAVLTLRKPGMGMFMKVSLFAIFVGAVLTGVIVLAAGAALDIGLYILLGLSFAAALMGFLSKSGNKVKK